jgi:hypothetical protein
MSPKQVWSQHLEVQEPSCFLSVTWCGVKKLCIGWGVQGIKILNLLGACFFAKCGSSVSERFLIYEALAVCFYTLVTILDPSLCTSLKQLQWASFYFHARKHSTSPIFTSFTLCALPPPIGTIPENDLFLYSCPI